jgi:hypothetical protein
MFYLCSPNTCPSRPSCRPLKCMRYLDECNRAARMVGGGGFRPEPVPETAHLIDTCQTEELVQRVVPTSVTLASFAPISFIIPIRSSAHQFAACQPSGEYTQATIIARLQAVVCFPRTQLGHSPSSSGDQGACGNGRFRSNEPPTTSIRQDLIALRCTCVWGSTAVHIHRYHNLNLDDVSVPTASFHRTFQRRSSPFSERGSQLLPDCAWSSLARGVRPSKVRLNGSTGDTQYMEEQWQRACTDQPRNVFQAEQGV